MSPRLPHPGHKRRAQVLRSALCRRTETLRETGRRRRCAQRSSHTGQPGAGKKHMRARAYGRAAQLKGNLGTLLFIVPTLALAAEATRESGGPCLSAQAIVAGPLHQGLTEMVRCAPRPSWFRAGQVGLGSLQRTFLRKELEDEHNCKDAPLRGMPPILGQKFRVDAPALPSRPHTSPCRSNQA